MATPKLMYWIEHKGKKILFFDHKNLSAKEFENAILETTLWFQDQISENRLQDKELLVFVDMKDTIVSQKALHAVKRFTAFEHCINKFAQTGISKPKKLLISLLAPFSRLEMKVFEKQEDALNWLAKD